MKTTKNIPALRFPGFQGGWREFALEDLMDFKNGANAEKHQYGKGRKFISVLDIIAPNPITHNSIVGSVDISDADAEKYDVKRGDILFQRSSETREEAGQSNVYLDDADGAVFGGFVIRGRPKTAFNSEFLCGALKTRAVRKDITSKSGGSTRYNVGQDTLGTVSVFMPLDQREQGKISEFLGAIDVKIAQLEKKKALLESYRNGSIASLFSQKLRFRSASGKKFPPWKTSALGDLVAFQKGRGVSRDQVVADGRTPCIRYGELYTHYGRRITSVRSRTNIPVKELLLSEAGDVIIPSSGESAWDIATASSVEVPGVALGGDLNILRGAESGAFLAYYLTHHKRREIAQAAQGFSVVHLYADALRCLKVDMPCIEEQQKIVAYLTTLEDMLSTVECSASAMRRTKAGLLQSLFV